MGSAKNYKKEYVRWYKEIFVPSCAAYAVAYDWTDQAYILENAPKKEAEFKFASPGVTNASSPKKLKQARDAFFKGVQRTSAAHSNSIRGVSRRDFFDDFRTTLESNTEKYLVGGKVNLHGKEYSTAEFASKAEKLKESFGSGSTDDFVNTYFAAAKDQNYRIQFRDSRTALEDVFAAITKCPGPGEEPWKLGIWTMAQKFKFFNIPGAPDADLFNALISTSQVNNEPPGVASPAWAGVTGGFSPDKEGQTGVMNLFGGFFGHQPKGTKSLEASVLTGRYDHTFKSPSKSGAPVRAHKYKYTPITFYRPYGGMSAKSPLEEVPDLIEVDSGDIPKLTTEQVAAQTKTYQWKMTKGKTYTTMPGATFNARPVFVHNPAPSLGAPKNLDRLNKLWEPFSISAVTQKLGFKDGKDIKGWHDVYYTDREKLFKEFQKMVLAIGKSKFKARQQPMGGPGNLSHYDKILYTVLYGLQEPAPPPLPGDTPQPSGYSAPPKNVGKRPLRKGEVHAIELQCFLLENIKQLASIREKLNYKKIGKITNALPGNVISKINHGYPLENEPVGGSWPPLGGPDLEVYTLQNMCPDIWALMTPHIELYRVDYDKENLGNLKPIAEKRIPFKNFVDKADIEEITKSKYGRIAGAGIKSFRWSLDGVQPAEVDNMISATLVMHFQSVYDLFRHNQIYDASGNPTDEFQAGLETPGYLDLIIGSGVTTDFGVDPKPEEKKGQEANICGNLHQKYEGARFRIKAVVGWATPPNLTELQIPGYNSGQLGALAKAIDSSRMAFYLDVYSHQINFQQDGSLELEINYQASISNQMRAADADIFIGKELHSEELKNLDKQLEDPKVAKLTSDDYHDGVLSAEGQAKQKKTEEILQRQVDLMRKNRMHKYSVFLKELQAKNKVYGVRVPSETLLNPLRKMKPDDRLKAAKVRQSQDITSLVSSGKAAKKAAGKSEEELEKVTKEDQGEGGADDKDQTQDAKLQEMAKNVGIFATGNQDTVLVPYFYLGDLIDVLLETRLAHLVEKGGPKQSTPLQMLLGTVELVDPLTAFQIRSVAIECQGKGAPVIKRLADVDPLRFKKINGITTFMNIGSIPISIDKFNEWFLNRVVRAKKESYFLLNFIKDVCADLISGAYTESCFDDAFQFQVRFDTANFRLAPPTLIGKKNLTIEEVGRSVRKGRTLDKMTLTKDAKEGPCIPSVMLYSVDSRPMMGDRTTDISEGIYHYFIGGQCGLAKEIVFNRQDMPGYREARIMKDGSLGAQQLKELYSVNMNMIGNNLHKNGTFVYIDPIAIGAGSSRAVGGIPNIARLIGLGGYFLVTAVKSEISDSGFNTTVDAIQQATDFDRGLNDKLTGLTTPPPGDEKKPEDNPDKDQSQKNKAGEESAEGEDGGAESLGDTSGRTVGAAADNPAPADTPETPPTSNEEEVPEEDAITQGASPEEAAAAEAAAAADQRAAERRAREKERQDRARLEQASEHLPEDQARVDAARERLSAEMAKNAADPDLTPRMREMLASSYREDLRRAEQDLAMTQRIIEELS